ERRLDPGARERPAIRTQPQSQRDIMIKTFELPGEQAEYYATASGIGNWEAVNGSPYAIHGVLREARHWAQVTAGHDKLWLCWNVDPAWCLIQQALVQQISWTPLVGFDPRVGPPPLLPG
ncbi:hypothetical protein, partial [Staphylococcus borealis]|uniref:hypothetical protein n=1 Tax=Staphylococcus borealis TaxID=2742203 RepID=UPI0039E7F382